VSRLAIPVALLLTLVAALGTLAAACTDTEGVNVRIDGLVIEAELARTPEERARGLSGRESLAGDAGMLFVFQAEGQHAFWMRGMRFSLDFIWISSARRVVDMTENVPPPAPGETHAARPGLTAVTEEHFERSKLVVLGLTTKDPRHTAPADWTYERQLASDLLSDTRMYRLAAERRGMDDLAAVMRDLELVLLQASVTSEPDSEALGQIQRLIRKRDLLQKINVVTSRGI